MVRHASFTPQVQAIWNYVSYILNMEPMLNWLIKIERRRRITRGGTGIRELLTICRIVRFRWEGLKRREIEGCRKVVRILYNLVRRNKSLKMSIRLCTLMKMVNRKYWPLLRCKSFVRHVNKTINYVGWWFSPTSLCKALDLLSIRNSKE